MELSNDFKFSKRDHNQVFSPSGIIPTPYSRIYAGNHSYHIHIWFPKELSKPELTIMQEKVKYLISKRTKVHAFSYSFIPEGYHANQRT